MLKSSITRVVVCLFVGAAIVTGCSDDPTTSDESEALEQELASTQVQLETVTDERDALVAGDEKVAAPALDETSGGGTTRSIDRQDPEPLWEHTGIGDAVVPCLDCPSGLILSIHHAGNEGFAVLAVDASGSPVPGPRHMTNSGAVVAGFMRTRSPRGEQLDATEAATIVDTVGTYDGLVWFWPDESESTKVTQLAVRADGPWSITAWNNPSGRNLEVSDARGQVLHDHVSGVGDDIVYWQVPECDIDHIRADYQGNGRFLALGWGAFGNAPLLFDETEAGTYKAYDPFQEPLDAGWCDGLFMIEIRASGPWTLTVQPAE